MRLLEKLENRPLKIRCKEDQEVIIRSLLGSELDLLVDMRPFMQVYIPPSDNWVHLVTTLRIGLHIELSADGICRVGRGGREGA